MGAVNLAIKFLLEGAALVAFGFCGYHSTNSTAFGIAGALGWPVVAAVAWGIFAAPRSPYRFRGVALLGFETAFFLIASAALAANGLLYLCIALFTAFAINAALLRLYS